MRRREVIRLGSVALLSPIRALAQSNDARRIGLLFGTDHERAAPNETAFKMGMRDEGLEEGKHFNLLTRYSNGYVDRLSELAKEIISHEPAVVVTGATVSTLAVMQASPTVPIVCAALFNPIGRGMAASDARPGGQVTGLHWSIESLPGKQLETVRELVPHATRVGILVEPPGTVLPPILEAARVLGITILTDEVRAPEELEASFEKLSNAAAHAMLILGGPMFLSEHRRIVTLANQRRLPMLSGWREFVEAGGLVSYAVNLRDSYRRSASFARKILKGEKPGDLPIELPRLELVINQNAARALGLAIPPTLLARADEVIE